MIHIVMVVDEIIGAFGASFDNAERWLMDNWRHYEDKLGTLKEFSIEEWPMMTTLSVLEDRERYVRYRVQDTPDDGLTLVVVADSKDKDILNDGS